MRVALVVLAVLALLSACSPGSTDGEADATITADSSIGADASPCRATPELWCNRFETCHDSRCFMCGWPGELACIAGENLSTATCVGNARLVASCDPARHVACVEPAAIPVGQGGPGQFAFEGLINGYPTDRDFYCVVQVMGVWPCEASAIGWNRRCKAE